MPQAINRERQGAVVNSTLEAVGNGPAIPFTGNFNFVLSGDFVGTFRLAASWDAGATWIPVTSADGTVRTFTSPERLVLEEPEVGVLYRVECLAFTSGSAAWRFSK